MKLLYKILAATGNIRAMEKLHVDTFTEEKINSVTDKPFAKSQNELLYLSHKELGGFYYLKTIIIGKFNIKTTKGAILKITGNDFNFKIKTDMDEFESDYSNVSNRSITRIDFQLEKNQVDIFENKKIETLELITKKKTIFFKVI